MKISLLSQLISMVVVHGILAARTPVVGILSEPVQTNKNATEYMIAASYVKWLEMGGARSIPIPYDASPSDVEEIFPFVNGILFPGGGGKSLPPAAQHIWHMAEEENVKRGGFFPIFGTCLGFEYLLMLASEDESILESGFDAENISLPLHLYEGKDSRMYQDQFMRSLVETHNSTLNNHHFGLSPDTFSRNKRLSSVFAVTSVSSDRLGRPFVSTIESKDPDNIPYYGVQYHPEKNVFEYATYPGTNIPYEDIDHSQEGVLLGAHLARFFVNLTSVNVRRRTTTSGACIKSLTPVYSYPRRVGLSFQEYYVIPSANEPLSTKGRG